jgi:hypothetical protein
MSLSGGGTLGTSCSSCTVFWRDASLFPFGIIDVPRLLCPLDNLSMIDFALSLPADLTLDGRLEDEAIARAFPEMLSVPFDTQRPSVGALRPQWLIAEVVTAGVSPRPLGTAIAGPSCCAVCGMWCGMALEAAGGTRSWPRSFCRWRGILGAVAHGLEFG